MISRWQIQCKPVPCIWLLQPSNPSPQDAITVLGGAPNAAHVDLRPVEATTTEPGVAAISDAPAADFDSIFVDQLETEPGVSAISDAPTVSFDSIFVDQLETEPGVAVASDAPIAQGLELWFYASSQTDGMGAQAGAPQATHTP